MTKMREIIRERRSKHAERLKKKKDNYKASPCVVALSAYAGGQVAFMPPCNGFITNFTIFCSGDLESIVLGVGPTIAVTVNRNEKGEWNSAELDGMEIEHGICIAADFNYKEDTQMKEVHISFLFYPEPKKHKSFTDAETVT